jgi:hypothetical protein
MLLARLLQFNQFLTQIQSNFYEKLNKTQNRTEQNRTEQNRIKAFCLTWCLAIVGVISSHHLKAQWTLSGNFIYPTNLTHRLAINTNTLSDVISPLTVNGNITMRNGSTFNSNAGSGLNFYIWKCHYNNCSYI